MSDFDKYFKNQAEKEYSDIPDFVKERVEETLADLPENEPTVKKVRILPRIAAAVACFIFITVFLLPNISVAYAQALEQISVIGDIVHVVTVRNYFYSDEKHTMDINVPRIESRESDAADYVNKDVDEIVNDLVDKFYTELEIEKNENNSGYGFVDVEYEIITNTERWFTLKLSICETSASCNNYFKFYNIDMEKNKITEIGDLFNTDKFSDILVKEIKAQMKEQMKKDEGVIYWIDGSETDEEFSAVDFEHNYYWNKDGNLVIAFDKYEVGPGAMGTPEFIIKKDVIKDILKSEYYDIFGNK